MSLSEKQRSDLFATTQETRKAQPSYVPDDAIRDTLVARSTGWYVHEDLAEAREVIELALWEASHQE